MATHTETRFVPYSADLMFQVVGDVEHYPEFLPWVTALRVLSRDRDGEDEIVMADMQVGYRNISERYTSRARLDRAARVIDVTQTEGPFRRLDNHWRFIPRDGGCEIEFRIEFQFKNPLLNLVAGSMLERVVLKMADAFVKRAKGLSQHPA